MKKDNRLVSGMMHFVLVAVMILAFASVAFAQEESSPEVVSPAPQEVPTIQALPQEETAAQEVVQPSEKVPAPAKASVATVAVVQEKQVAADDDASTVEPAINNEGKLGFGFGLNAPVVGDAAPVKMGSSVFMRYWVSDLVAIEPEVKLNIGFEKDEEDNEEKTDINVSPGIMVVFAPVRGKATRMNVGFGFAFSYTSMERKTEESDSEYSYKTSLIGFDIPFMIGVEHFFVDWFSINVGAGFDFLSYDKQESESNSGGRSQESEPKHTVEMDIDSANLFVSLVFYTD